MTTLQLSVTKRCPKHGLALVWDAAIQLWVCPKYLQNPPTCTYTIPGEPPPTTSSETSVTE